jgi:peptidoglycan glycosyltransferase
LVLFGLLLINVNYIMAFQARDLRERPGNARLLLDEYSRERGPILLEGRPIAESKETADRLKYLRVYPDKQLYAAVTGYYSYIYGAAAIEHEENSILAGTDDRLFVRRVIDVLTGRRQQGGSVALTLNPKAQAVATSMLRETGKGAVVAINPSSGAILAMVTNPTYDPNTLSSHNSKQIRASWEKLNADPAQPLLNRTIARTYPPGSTFKLVTSAAALSSGRYTPDSTVPGPAQLDLPQTTRNLPNYDNRPCSPGSDTTTLATALARSCNTTFGALGLDLGDDALRDQAEKFGFNKDDIQVPMPAATSVYPRDLDQPQTALSAIGQFDVRATPLQMAMVAAGIANRGIVMKPYLVDEVLAPDLASLDKAEPEELSEAVTPQVAAQLRDMMVGVVESPIGTGKNARIPGVEVAGKTGTAQQATGKPPHAWFVSFAPAQAPQVAVAVVIEDGGGQPEVSGNKLAAPIAREVMKAVLGITGQ